MKHFSIWLRKRQVRQFLWNWALGAGRWRPLLPLEHKKNEMDWCWEILRGSGRTFGLYHLKCHPQFSPPVNGEQTWHEMAQFGQGHMGWRLRLWRWDQLEVDRLQSLSTPILGGGRTKQPEYWRMYAPSVGLGRARGGVASKSQVERLFLQCNALFSVQEEDLRSRDQQHFGQSNPNPTAKQWVPGRTAERFWLIYQIYISNIYIIYRSVTIVSYKCNCTKFQLKTLNSKL